MQLGGGEKGGGQAINGVLRTDGEIAESLRFDQLLVSDLGLDIPTYSTSSQTLYSERDQASLNWLLDYDFDYVLVQKYLAIPIYNSSESFAGRLEWNAGWDFYEVIHVRPDNASALSQNIKNANQGFNGQSSYGQRRAALYWKNASEVQLGYVTTYGIGFGSGSKTATGTTITIGRPSFSIQGNATQFSSTAWDMLEDIRLQCAYELWKFPYSDVPGWAYTSGLNGIFEDISNGGTLT